MKTEKAILFLFASFLIAGCSQFQKTNNLSAADKSKAANHPTSNAAPTQSAPLERKISGKVYCGHGLSQAPASKAQIELTQNSVTVFSGKSDASGNYVILQTMEPKKIYFLSAKSKCGETRTEVGFAKNAKELIQDLYLGED